MKFSERAKRLWNGPRPTTLRDEKTQETNQQLDDIISRTNADQRLLSMRYGLYRRRLHADHSLDSMALSGPVASPGKLVADPQELILEELERQLAELKAKAHMMGSELDAHNDILENVLEPEVETAIGLVQKATNHVNRA